MPSQIDTLYYTTKSVNPVIGADGKPTGETELSGNNNGLSPMFNNPPVGGKGFFSGRRLTDSKFDQHFDDQYYILFEGVRIPNPTPKSNYPNHLGVPIYKEDVNIVTPQGTMHASQVYPDSGSGSDTSVPFVEFIVTSGTGIYENAGTILFEYNNNTASPKPWSIVHGQSVPNSRRLSVFSKSSNEAGSARSQLKTHHLKKLF